MLFLMAEEIGMCDVGEDAINFLHSKETAVVDVVLHLIAATHIIVIKQDITSLLISTHVQCVDFECDTNY